MTLRSLTLALAFVLLPAAAAQATDYTATLGGQSLKYEWDGGPGNSVIGDATLDAVADCGPGHDCDNLLVKTDDAGSLVVAISGTSDSNVDTDLYVYESDSSGKKGKPMGEGVTFSPEDSVSVRVKAGGYYLAVVSYRTAIAASYKGTATLKPSAASVAPPVAQARGTTDEAPGITLGRIPARKVKRFSGTASDDKAVQGIEFALFSRKGSKCAPLTAKRSFGKPGSCTAPIWLAAKGTTKWSFALRKALKKGTYLVAVRATDSAGAKSQLLYRTFKAR
jgi:hypothetical protein